MARKVSFILDERYLLACTRYVELNPVRAGMVKSPQYWQWSSAAAHIKRKYDILVKTKPLFEIARSPWKKFLSTDAQASDIALFKKHERTCRPLVAEAFIEKLEQMLDRKLKPQKPGPRVKDK